MHLQFWSFLTIFSFALFFLAAGVGGAHCGGRGHCLSHLGTGLCRAQRRRFGNQGCENAALDKPCLVKVRTPPLLSCVILVIFKMPQPLPPLKR